MEIRILSLVLWIEVELGLHFSPRNFSEVSVDGGAHQV